MAAPSNTMEATNLFGLGANFNPQTSNADLREDAANIMDATGNIECETMVNERTEYSNSFAYCNGTPDIKTDLATLLTKFGDVHDSKKVDTLTINFEKGQYATVDIAGHNHTRRTRMWRGYPMVTVTHPLRLPLALVSVCLITASPWVTTRARSVPRSHSAETTLTAKAKTATTGKERPRPTALS